MAYFRMTSYLCPRAILDTWPLLAEGYGLEVEQARADHKTSTSFSSVSYEWKIYSPLNQMEITVGYERRDPPELLDLFWERTFHLARLHQKDVELARLFERILLASGARSDKPFSCREIFRCDWNMIRDLRQAGILNGHPLTRTRDVSFSCKERNIPRVTYFDALLGDGKATLELSTGPGVDPETGNFVHFVALDDRHIRGFLLRFSVRRLLREIIPALEGLGAQRLSPTTALPSDLAV